ncbi:flippase [Mucilaginibacter robiniae]|uniref:Flippase n=1 Tax=Mucilaginibacter robiniae TaxID=2728022 RepID=A0A7L5DXP1_9SPHI|nr:flippase [Mucilaginibacter robiniae]QJD95531.1 flippase [Mucilaginibacter robiniae]
MRIPSIPGFDQQAFEKYLKNTGWLMLAKVGVMLVKSVVTTFALSNYLEASQFGILNYPMTIVTFSTAIAALGLDGFVTRELISRPEKKEAYLGTAFILRLLAGFGTLPLVYLAYHIINSAKPLQTPFHYVLIVAFIAVVQSVNIIDSFFQSKVQGKYIMYVQLAGNVLSTLTKLAFIVLKLPLIWFVYSLLLDAVFVAGSYLVMYQLKGNHIQRWKFDSSIAGYLLKHSWPLAFSAVLNTIYMKIDQGMIGTYLEIKQLGIYSNVANLSESYYFIPLAVVSSVFPAIMHARNTDQERYYKRLQNLYDLMVVLSVGAAIVLSFGSTYIYHWFLKREYWAGAPVLAVYVWAGVFAFLGVASGQYLIAEGYTKLAMLRTAAGALVNVILNIFWIPRYGIMGAAYATLIAYGVAAFFILFIPRTRGQGIQMLKSLFLISLFQKITNR